MSGGDQSEQLRNVIALGAWENEGGAPGHDCLGEHHGGRIEIMAPGCQT